MENVRCFKLKVMWETSEQKRSNIVVWNVAKGQQLSVNQGKNQLWSNDSKFTAWAGDFQTGSQITALVHWISELDKRAQTEGVLFRFTNFHKILNLELLSKFKNIQRIQFWNLSWPWNCCIHTFGRRCLQVLWFCFLCFGCSLSALQQRNLSNYLKTVCTTKISNVYFRLIHLNTSSYPAVVFLHEQNFSTFA